MFVDQLKELPFTDILVNADPNAPEQMALVHQKLLDFLQEGLAGHEQGTQFMDQPLPIPPKGLPTFIKAIMERAQDPTKAPVAVTIESQPTINGTWMGKASEMQDYFTVILPPENSKTNLRRGFVVSMVYPNPTGSDIWRKDYHTEPQQTNLAELGRAHQEVTRRLRFGESNAPVQASFKLFRLPFKS